ncbi:hypothetical protein [Candidatus Methylomicrobium oryzae]|jgi:hypothetical protein|uniref:hypothetical protein n=1 Tax=Candidatus Methylomicrobium oryzae TaxID=2802053 RepID=UPI001922D2C3|nr:hypothetical protein [Methylomicrobium sp. RS1]MBL1263823.1 hypothetical protein [Methylomicrobium sp. RS1]
MKIAPVSFKPSACRDGWVPEKVFLFSGHMIDSPGRKSPRFPAAKENIAGKRIAAVLSDLQAGPHDLGLTQGACGGDILFAEACRQRGVRLQLLQPFEEPVFIEKSVAIANANWLKRYRAITESLETPPLAAPRALGELSPDTDPYERCNLWLLASALAYGPEKLTFICLWDGSGGDGPGGTAHMVKEVEKRNGRVVWLNTKTLE